VPEPPVYLDHHATTPVDPRVVEAMAPWWTERFGNPASATHRYGWEAEGFEAHVVPVAADGLVDPERVEAALGEQALLVSVGAANAEIGVLQPLEAIGERCRRRGVAFHSDAAQAVGKIPIDVERLGVDLLSFCAHKLYGPKGIGALYVRGRRGARGSVARLRLVPILHGGGHERGRRSGTLPVPLVVGFARAVELCLEEQAGEAKRQGQLRDHLWERLREGLAGVHRNGHPERRLPGNLSVAFEGVEADALIASLREFALSAGSACASGSGEPSHVLRAIGLPTALARGALRVGLGRSNTLAQIDRLADRLIEEVEGLRAGRRG
jgi:cysteine desulfurase